MTTEIHTAPFVISEKAAKAIDQWVAKYPKEQARSAIVAALTLVQAQNGGWLSKPAIKAVADYLGIPEVWAYEVVTFYDMFETEPVGKYKIRICTNLSCQLRGCEEIVDHLEKRLGITLGETTADGKFTLREAECMAACGGAPMCQINDKDYIENLTPEKMDKILNHLSKEDA